MVRVVSMVLLVSACRVTAERVEIVRHVNEDDASDIQVLCSRNGIHVRKDREASIGGKSRYVIKATEADAANAIQLLRDYALPRNGPRVKFR